MADENLRNSEEKRETVNETEKENIRKQRKSPKKYDTKIKTKRLYMRKSVKREKKVRMCGETRVKLKAK